MRRAAVSLTTTCGFVAVLLSAAVVLGQHEWRVTYTPTQICALKGSTVEIRSTYTCPSRINGRDTRVEKKFWFTNNFVDLKTVSEYKDRVQYNCGKTECTLRISDLRQSDSAEYKFRFTTNQPGGTWFGSPGATLSVTGPDLQVHVTASSPCAFSKTCVDAELRCQSSCRLPDRFSYVWIKNGREVLRETASSYSVFIHSEDIISCAVKGYEMFPSPPMYAPRLPSVSVSPSGQIVEGSSVTLTCSGDANPPITKYTWNKKNRMTDRQLDSKNNQLVFESIQSSDSGEYYCRVQNRLWITNPKYIHIDVKYPPRLPSVSASPSGQIAEGSSVTLTCSGDANPAANYTWYKEDEDSPKASGQNFTIIDFRPEHSGNYYCEAQNSRGRLKSTSHPVVASRSSTSVAAGLTVTVLLLVIIISVFLFWKRKRASRKTTEPEVKPDSSERRQPEDQDSLQYVAVNFSQNQADPVYSNTGPARLHRHKEEQTLTEYAAVAFHNTSTDHRTAEDPAELYSTVNTPQ